MHYFVHPLYYCVLAVITIMYLYGNNVLWAFVLFCVFGNEVYDGDTRRNCRRLRNGMTSLTDCSIRFMKIMQTAKSPINLYREFLARLITPYHIHCVAVADFVSVEKRPFRPEIGEVKGLVKHLKMLHFTPFALGGNKAFFAAADV